MVATDPGDVVARVNGRPVYASCVAAQGKAHRLDLKRALDECIAFELMAQEAERRGLDRDREVVLATKTALVAREVQIAFEDGFQDPTVFGEQWQKFLKKFDWHVRHEDYRASAYVRIPVPKGAPPDVDAKAHALAEKLAAAVAPERGMLADHLRAIAEKIVGPMAKPCQEETVGPCWDSIDPYRRYSLDEGYGKALFALDEPGRATGAVRTTWGWDVIVWTEDVPATTPTQAEIDRQMLPEFKQLYFSAWVQDLEHELHVKIERSPDEQKLLGSEL